MVHEYNDAITIILRTRHCYNTNTGSFVTLVLLCAQEPPQKKDDNFLSYITLIRMSFFWGGS